MKPIYWLLVIAVLLTAFSVHLPGETAKSSIEVRQIKSMDREILEAWERVTPETDVLGISAVRTNQAPRSWQVTINAAEFVREDTLAARLKQAVTAAIMSVKGVKAFVREDREVWAIQGEPKGDELVRACAAAIDQLAPEIRKHLKSLTTPDR